MTQQLLSRLMIIDDGNHGQVCLLKRDMGNFRKVTPPIEYHTPNPILLRGMQDGLDSLSGRPIEIKGILYKFVCQTGLFSKALRGEHVLEAILWDSGDLHIALSGKALDEGIHQAKGNIELTRQLPLSEGGILFDFFENAKGMDVPLIHKRPSSHGLPSGVRTDAGCGKKDHERSICERTI